MFYIWDTRDRDGNATFWRERAAGYTANLDEAGLFTAEEVKARGLEWHQVAIPREQVEPLTHRAVKVRRMPDPPEEPEHIRVWREKMCREAEAREIEDDSARREP